MSEIFSISITTNPMKTSIRTANACLLLATLLSTASAQDKAGEPLNVEKPIAEFDIPINKPPQTRASELTDMVIFEESIEAILNNKANPSTIDKLKAPICIESFEDAVKHLTRASFESLDDKVDFSKDKILLFVWQGSTTDNFYVSPMISRPPSAKFTYDPGQEKEQKTHVKIFALQKDAEWSVSSNEIIQFKCKNDANGQIELNVKGADGVKLDMKLEINGQEVPLHAEGPKE